MRFAQLVLGPAGSGKSTYCDAVQKHGEIVGRPIQIFNLDPAAEHFNYSPTCDIRDLIQVDDVMEADDLKYGPNGGLIFCMEYLMEADGLEWLKEALGDYNDDYILFDCPGQIELYTHMDIMKKFGKQLVEWEFQVCVVFVLDSHYMVDAAKFLSGTLTSLSTMMKLELPQVNILSKMDLLSQNGRKQLELFLDPDIHELLASDHASSNFDKKYRKLSSALAQIIEDYSLVRFTPFDITKEETILDVINQVDISIQFGEDIDVKTKDFEYPDPEENAGADIFDNFQ